MDISLLNKQIIAVTVSGWRDSNISLNMAVVLPSRMAQQLSDAVPKGSLLHQAKLSRYSRRGLVLGVYVCASVCMCVPVCICAYVCACMYMCIPVHVYTHMCAHVYMCVHMCTCAYLCMRIRACMYLCICAYVCMCAYVYICVHMCVFVSMCTHVFLYMQRLKVDIGVFLSHFPLQVLRQGLLLNLELNAIGLTGWPASPRAHPILVSSVGLANSTATLGFLSGC